MNDKSNLTQLFDIEPPLAPGSSPYPDMLLASAILLAGIILLGLYIRRYASRRQRARRELARLARDISRQADADRPDEMNAQYLAYRVAEIVRDGLRLRGLTASTALPDDLFVHRQRWGRFITALDQARYMARDTGRDTDVLPLINEADFWLGKWPRC